MLISFFEFQVVPKDSFYVVNINFDVNKENLLFSKGYALYRVQYDVFEGKGILKSEIMDYELSDSLNVDKISLNLDYDRTYKIVFKIVDLNANSYILDTAFGLNIKSNPYLIIGTLKTEKINYSLNDTMLKISIPIYSKIDDSIKIELKIEGGKIVKKQPYKLYISKGENRLDLFYDIRNLRLDRYEGEVYVNYKNFKLSQKFNFYKLGPFNMTKLELDNLVFALNYLYTGEFDKYLKENNNDLQKAWEKFWQDKDPTPNTKPNEQKEQFLQRYKVVIKQFTRNNRINDMGLIYLKYGPPDYIEKNEINLYDRPYQIWYYETLNLRFVFIDKFGTGDYELSPLNWYNDFR